MEKAIVVEIQLSLGVLTKMDHASEVAQLQDDWNKFLSTTKNPILTNYSYYFSATPH
jgi:hypothetical protein